MPQAEQPLGVADEQVPARRQLLEEPFQKRLSRHLGQDLWPIGYRRAKAGSKTASQNDRCNITKHTYTFLIGERFSIRYPLISS